MALNPANKFQQRFDFEKATLPQASMTATLADAIGPPQAPALVAPSDAAGLPHLPASAEPADTAGPEVPIAALVEQVLARYGLQHMPIQKPLFPMVEDSAPHAAPTPPPPAFLKERESHSVHHEETAQDRLARTCNVRNGKKFVLSTDDIPLHQVFNEERCGAKYTEERRLQLFIYLKTHRIVLNSRGCLQCPKDAEARTAAQERAIQNLGICFYHYPFQVLSFLFIQNPSDQKTPNRTGHSPIFWISPRSRHRAELTETVKEWIDLYPHTVDEVRGWIRLVEYKSPRYTRLFESAVPTARELATFLDERARQERDGPANRPLLQGEPQE